MNEQVLRRDLFLLLGYMLTSARGLFDEPKGYGPFRLVDTAGRILEIMENHELDDDFLRAPGGGCQRALWKQRRRRAARGAG